MNNRAYLACGTGGLVILDVSDPTRPVRVGAYTDTGDARDVQVVGKLLYLADQTSGLEILDVSNPDAPKRVGAHAPPNGYFHVQVAGSLAFLASLGTLDILNVTDPTRPTRLGQPYDAGPPIWGLHVVGTLAYLAEGDAELEILDVSNPATPVRLSVHDTSGFARTIRVIGGLAYVADGEGGLLILDVSRPVDPVEVRRYPANAHHVEVVDSRALLTTGEGLSILDVCNPALPSKVGGLDHLNSVEAVQDVEVVGTLAYVAVPNGGLHILDVSGPTPVRLGRYDPRGSSRQVQVVGNLAYVADGEAGLTILDVADSAKPVRVAGYPARDEV